MALRPQPGNAGTVYGHSATSHGLPFGACVGDSRTDALANQFALEDSAMAATTWNISRPDGVLPNPDSMSRNGNEGEAIGVKVGQSGDQMLERTPEAVNLPHHDCIELAAMGIGHQAVQLWS